VNKHAFGGAGEPVDNIRDVVGRTEGATAKATVDGCTMNCRCADGVAEIVAFWRAAGPRRWFAKDPAFDAHFRSRFLDCHFAAARRECDGWMTTPQGALALLLLLDQFPRNAFRDTAHMYATDPLARLFASQALTRGHDLEVERELRRFFYLPFAHSEKLEDQRLSVKLSYRASPNYLETTRGHSWVIQQFGRFPHRNEILGRKTTKAEAAFLRAGGFAG
jgi:uncharacterized protein (DUF924 family)